MEYNSWTKMEMRLRKMQGKKCICQERSHHLICCKESNSVFKTRKKHKLFDIQAIFLDYNIFNSLKWYDPFSSFHPTRLLQLIGCYKPPINTSFSNSASCRCTLSSVPILSFSRVVFLFVMARDTRLKVSLNDFSDTSWDRTLSNTLLSSSFSPCR